MGKSRSPVINRIAALLLLPVAVSVAPAASFQPGERLDYTFSYRGVFSGFIEIDIARAHFVVTPRAVSIDGYPVYRASMDLTTEPFAKAELIYPIRYRYRCWLEPSHQTPLLVLEYLDTDEVEEELLWFDRERGLGFRYQKAQVPSGQEAGPPAFPTPEPDLDPKQWSLAEGAHPQPLPETGVWDYLSMLYRLRFGELPAGYSIDLPVYDGKRIKIYRAEFTRERLVWVGWDLPAFKLNLFEVRDGRRKGDSVTSIWISDDARRRPLRFHMERGFGVFEGILETDRPLGLGKTISPRPPAKTSS